MTRIELTLAAAGVLLFAFALGWGAHWLWSRLSRAAAPRQDRADELAAELLELETERNRIVAEARASEAAERATAAETKARLETALREREAELAATMDGLRAARAEIDAARRG